MNPLALNIEKFIESVKEMHLNHLDEIGESFNVLSKIMLLDHE